VVFSARIKNVELAPPRSYYYPEVLSDISLSKVEESCQHMNETTPQHLVTNIFAANILLTACCELLTNGNILKGIVYFNSFKFFSRFQEYSKGEK
jgi:hypothetical protein